MIKTEQGHVVELEQFRRSEDQKDTYYTNLLCVRCNARAAMTISYPPQGMGPLLACILLGIRNTIRALDEIGPCSGNN